MLNDGMEKKFFHGSILFLLVAIVVFTVTGMVRHDYYSYVIYHHYPMAYLQNFLLFTCFVLAMINAWIIYRKVRRFSVIWSLMTLGFLYLTIDAFFSIHQ
jgi:hypothetical protein